jgi:DNA polymerase-3 subunit gamma/tau
MHSRGANLQGLGRDLLEVLRNLAVAKLPQLGAFTPLSDLPDHEAVTLRKLAQAPSMRDLMRLFRLMAQTQEEVLRSPYADLLLEMAVVRMATLAPVIDGEELARAIKALGGAPPASGGGGVGGGQRGPSIVLEPAPAAAPARRLKVEGEVKADAPLRKATRPSAPRETALAEPPKPAADSGNATADLPDLREYIRQKKAALAGFMELGAGLEVNGDILRVTPRNDIYVRYLNDNKSTISALAAEHYGRPIRVELAQPPTEGDLAQPATPEAPSKPINAAAAQPAPTRPLDWLGADEASAAPAPAAVADGEPINREEARKELFADPLVRKILDELEGRLVDVRRPPGRRNGSG